MGIFKNRRSGRPWKDELNQLEKIRDILIIPLLNHKPEEMGEHVYLEKMFCTQERLIGKFRAKAKLKLPGLFAESPNIRIQGWGYRKVYKGAVLHVRHDITMDTFDVSYFGDVGKQEQMFTLTMTEWLSIQQFLEPLDSEAGLIRFRDRMLK